MQTISEANKKWDFDRLTPEQQAVIAKMIAEDNLAKSNSKVCPVAPVKTVYTVFVKRIIDVLLSFIALIILLPVNIIIGIITLVDVGLPLFFRQERIGRNNRVFKLVKFRNMTNKTDENGVILPADQRVTKWGKFVRKTSLDELLNFWSIFKGDMSLIGPRPLPVVYKGRFNNLHESRHNVRPGLDCPLHDSSMGYMTWKSRLDNDAWYVENISFKTDCKMVSLLFKETFFGAEKKSRADGGSEGTFMGYDENGEVMNSFEIPDKYFIAALGEDKNAEH